MLTTSSWWSTLIPFSRSVLTISKWPSAAARWRAVCPVCNKQSKREIKFHENEAEKKHTQQKKNQLKQVILRHANLSKKRSAAVISTQYLSVFFLFLFSCFLCLFFCPLSQQHFSRLLEYWPQPLLFVQFFWSYT